MAPEFDDNLNLEDYLDWVQAIKRIFELKEYNDEKSFKLVIPKLKGYASLWYERLKKSRVREAKSKIETWSKVNKYMGKRFLPPAYKQELYLKINSHKKQNLKVEEYNMELEQVQMRVGLDEEHKLKIARFIKGLSPSIANKVYIQAYLFFDDVCHLAIKVEKQFKCQKPFQRTFICTQSTTKGYSTHKVDTTPTPTETADKGLAVSHQRGWRVRSASKCHGYGHF